MTKRIAILGGGIAGLSAAWQLAGHARAGADLEATLFEASPRLGGIVETVHTQGFTIECGPDAWVSEKPWARQLALELGLEHELLPSGDSTRKTHIFLDGRLETMPDGMRMMVPTHLDLVDSSPLFSPEAKQAYRDELPRAAQLKAFAQQAASAPDHDESIAAFTRRHFGEEVLNRIAAPLLSGVLGGDVEQLSVRAVMPQFVAMEREHGSLIAALQSAEHTRAARSEAPTPIFTTLRSGLNTLIDRLTAAIPAPWLRPSTSVTAISRSPQGWTVHTPTSQPFDAVLLATPAHITRSLLHPLDPTAADLLPTQATSAIIVAFGYPHAPDLSLPPGFGFLVPPSPSNDPQLLACTFVDQKFPHRVPAGGRLLRAFFGGAVADRLLSTPDDHIAALARHELHRILGPLPNPSVTIVRRWPESLPQYAVGHLARISALDARIADLPGLTLLGNALRGVGLPDLIRDARRAADTLARA